MNKGDPLITSRPGRATRIGVQRGASEETATMARGLGHREHGVRGHGSRIRGGKKTAKVGPQPSSSPGNNRRGAGEGASSGGRGGGSRPRGKPARLPPPPPRRSWRRARGHATQGERQDLHQGPVAFRRSPRGWRAALASGAQGPRARRGGAQAPVGSTRRVYHRLGERARGFAHLLDPGARAMTQGSGRGEEGTRARGSSRAVLRVGTRRTGRSSRARSGWSSRRRWRGLRTAWRRGRSTASARRATRSSGSERCTRGRCKKTPSSESSFPDAPPVRMPRRAPPPVRMPRWHRRRPRLLTGRGGPSRWAPSYRFTASRRATW